MSVHNYTLCLGLIIFNPFGKIIVLPTLSSLAAKWHVLKPPHYNASSELTSADRVGRDVMEDCHLVGRGL